MTELFTGGLALLLIIAQLLIANDIEATESSSVVNKLELCLLAAFVIFPGIIILSIMLEHLRRASIWKKLESDVITN